jgi:hypothetical protein
MRKSLMALLSLGLTGSSGTRISFLKLSSILRLSLVRMCSCWAFFSQTALLTELMAKRCLFLQTSSLDCGSWMDATNCDCSSTQNWMKFQYFECRNGRYKELASPLTGLFPTRHWSHGSRRSVPSRAFDKSPVPTACATGLVRHWIVVVRYPYQDCTGG